MVLGKGGVQLREITMLIRSNRGHAAGEGALFTWLHSAAPPHRIGPLLSRVSPERTHMLRQAQEYNLG